MISFSRTRNIALFLPIILLLGAYGSQYIAGLFPCEMCWWQRYPHMIAIPISLLAYFVSNAGMQRMLVALAALAILTSGFIGGFHAGVEYGWWEGMTSCTSTVGGTGEDFLKSIMDAPLIRCDVAPWSLFGISLAGYNFLLSTGAAIVILLSLWKKS